MGIKTIKIILGFIVILALFAISSLKIDAGFYSYLSNLLSGAYKEQTAKISFLNSPEVNGEAGKATSSVPTKKCLFETSGSPTHTPVIFQEIAWMGDSHDTTNEWIVLKNMSSSDADISNWQIINQNKRLKIILPKGKMLNISKPIFTIARHSKIDGITVDFMFIGAIKNQNESLRLFDGDCKLIDEVNATPNWPAGNNGSASLTSSSAKKPMVRLANLNWQTKSGSTTLTTSEIVTNKVATSEVKTAPQATPTVAAPPKCININTAPDIELQKIIHIGPKLATQIIQLRTEKQFSSVDDLIKVKGIGSSTLADIRKEGLVCVE